MMLFGGLKGHLDTLLYGDNYFANAIAKVGYSTGLGRTVVGWTVIWVAASIVLLFKGGDLIILLVGFIHPIIKSAQAIDRQDREEQDTWLMFWVVNTLAMAGFALADQVLFWAPALYPMKIAFLIWILAPEPMSGAVLIYTTVIRGAIEKVQTLMHKNEESEVLKLLRMSRFSSYTEPDRSPERIFDQCADMHIIDAAGDIHLQPVSTFRKREKSRD